jgi:hypothetical protein
MLPLQIRAAVGLRFWHDFAMPMIEKIVSGGQTGADRAPLIGRFKTEFRTVAGAREDARHYFWLALFPNACTMEYQPELLNAGRSQSKRN